ncbi:MAG: DUF1743 domain-containing protein [Candidatus Thermoplasmatota archaeon]|nr:DUF1743 domain-containing protein [Candidatus Thermoplasmatota archaeon]
MIDYSCQSIWLALDDTDEREHGCTTYDFDNLLRYLEEDGCQIDEVRLVRLWPFAPRRTRGNAALSAKISFDIEWTKVSEMLSSWFQNTFGELAESDCNHSAQPVLLATSEQPDEEMYWRTVRGHVEIESVLSELEMVPHKYWSSKRGNNGIIGCCAAIAWRGNIDYTWEYTAWRKSIDVSRNVPGEIVSLMTEKFPSTIMNRDPNSGRSLIAPRTPCPVLYGIRGESEKGVVSAHDFLQENGVEIALCGRAHRTNQATDDHLESVQSGRIQSSPTVMKGGHVELDVGLKLIAFSKGGAVNKLAQNLQIGDEIEWYGLQSHDESVHLEKIRLKRGIRNRKRPICDCGSRFKSKGKDQSLECPSCKSQHEDVWDYQTESTVWLEPPHSNRRHLSKPTSRRGKSEVND